MPDLSKLKTVRLGLYGFAASLIVCGPAAWAQGQGKPDTDKKPDQEEAAASESKDVSLTIYNQNFGLVRDVREIILHQGTNHISFDDVAAGIDPTSVSFVSLTAPNAVTVREQNYRYDPMDINTVLSRSVGKDVKFRQILPAGGERIVEGKLLASPAVSYSDSYGNIFQTSQSIVVKTASGVVIAPSGQLELAELPAGLVAKPTLVWKLDCDKAGAHKAEIGYQTQGLNWKCDYVAVDNADDTGVDLTSWVTLDNKSGASYNAASLKLLAGDVHKVTEDLALGLADAFRGRDAYVREEPQFSEQSFAEYHLYSLAGRTSLRDNETKQMTLFSADTVPVKKLFVFEPAGPTPETGGGDESKIKVKLELVNSKDNHMGMALPKGKVRVYKRDNDKSLQFIGEDLIDHTPRDEKVRLEIGNAFDLVGALRETNVQSKPHFESHTYELSLRNHKDVPVTITFIGHASNDWKITDFSMPFNKKDANTFEFVVRVDKNAESKVTYTVESHF